jgi:hypothetical protein
VSYLNQLPAKWWRKTSPGGNLLIRLGDTVEFFWDSETLCAFFGVDEPTTLTPEEVIDLVSLMMYGEFRD